MPEFEEHRYDGVIIGAGGAGLGLAIVAAIVMQLSLPHTYTIHPSWAIPAVEALLLVGIYVADGTSMAAPVAFSGAGRNGLTTFGKVPSLLSR